MVLEHLPSVLSSSSSLSSGLLMVMMTICEDIYCKDSPMCSHSDDYKAFVLFVGDSDISSEGICYHSLFTGSIM